MRVRFFFSSRRRHTRCSRDWSSDVCSSDLQRRAAGGSGDAVAEVARQQVEVGRVYVAVEIEIALEPPASSRRAEVGGERSEERRVGKEWKSRWWRSNENKETSERELGRLNR